jgi:hypothetical protein
MTYLGELIGERFDSTVTLPIGGQETNCLALGQGLFIRCDDAYDLVREVKSLMIEQHDYDMLLSKYNN